MATRRSFIASLLAAAAIPRLGWADAGSPDFLAAAREPDGGFALFGLDAAGAELFRIPLPDRGHAAAAHPTAPEAVAFARRPGTFALVIDCVTGQVLRRLASPEGRHFYGHGAYLADGDVLATTENDIATGQGRIALWSRAEGYRRIGDIASGGIGPHELRSLDARTLAVANGGIRTDPDRGREKLNLDTMRPNLAYVDLDRGPTELVELAPDLHQASIRHLAIDGAGQVAFAMQWQGDRMAGVPLMGLHRRGTSPRLLSADLAEQIALQGYAGSVAFDGAGGRVAITSPRGGRLHVYEADSFAASLRQPDICGVAPAAGGFVAIDGLGGVFAFEGAALTPLRHYDRAWDNHLVAISAAA